jgi:hypothetical protein
MSELERPVRGVIVRPDCTYEETVFKQLTDYQKAIDGFITAVRFYSYDGAEVACGYVDDEGLLKRLPLNPLGSAISFLFGNSPYLAGNLIIVGKADAEGYDTDAPDYLLELVRNICDGSKLESDV